MNLTIFSHCIILAFYICAVTYFYCRILTPKKHIKNPYLASVLLMSPDLLVCIYNYHDVTYIHWLMIMLPLFFLFQDSIRKRITCYVTVNLILMFSELFGFFISCTLISLALGRIVLPAEVTNGQAILSSLCIIFSGMVLIWITFSYIIKLFQYLKMNTLFLIGLPVILCTIVHILVEDSSWGYLIIALFILCYFFLHKGFQNMRKQEIERLQREKQSLIIEKQLAFSKDLEKEYRELRKWSHDIDNHILALSYLMQKEKYEDCINYIEHIKENAHVKDCNL